MRSPSRREFVVGSAASAIGMTIDPSSLAFDATDAGWFDTPMRWAQLTLVENDPGRFDPAFKPRVTESSGYLAVTVPSIFDHEVVAVDL